MKQSSNELHASIRRALACTDECWYRHLLLQDASGCPLSADEINSVLHDTMAAAADVSYEMAQIYPSLSPAELAQALGLTIIPMDDNTGMGQIPLLGLYQPSGRQILLHEDTLVAIKEFITTHGLESLTPVKDLRACVLYHEIFHAVEDIKPRIFTRSAMLQRKLFGLIPLRRGLASASEIGAIHFSRLMAKTSYSPSIFGCYLLLAGGRIDLAGLPG